MPLGGFDIVLGVQWLRTLGLILWDFDALFMLFWRKDHQVTWKGKAGPLSKSQAHSIHGSDLMATLLEEYFAVFATPMVCRLQGCVITVSIFSLVQSQQ